MQLSRTRGYRISVGDYESMEISATVTFNHRDLGYDDDEVAQLTANDLAFLDELTRTIHIRCEETLNKMLAADLEEARKTATPGRSVFFPGRSETQRRSGR